VTSVSPLNAVVPRFATPVLPVGWVPLGTVSGGHAAAHAPLHGTGLPPLVNV
jgi:hypothetical protein